MSDAPVFIAGHSKGGPTAALYAFSRLKRGLRVDGIYTFEPAMPGDHTIGLVLAPVPIRLSTWNLRDPVPAAPIDLEFLNEEYEQPWKPTETAEEPPPDDEWGLLRDHHMYLCQRAVRKLPPTGGAIELVEAADAVQRLYDTNEGWDWLNPVDGAWWAVKVFPNGARLAIARGSETPKDWYYDFNALQTNVMGSRVSRGFWDGVAPASDGLDQQLG